MIAIADSELLLPVAVEDVVDRLPDGAVSVVVDGKFWLLRASQALQVRFEELLERGKAGLRTPSEDQEYEAICQLDQWLSDFNRLARRLQTS